MLKNCELVEFGTFFACIAETKSEEEEEEEDDTDFGDQVAQLMLMAEDRRKEISVEDATKLLQK